MMDCQGGTEEAVWLPVDVPPCSGTDFISKLLLPPSVEKIVCYYVDGGKVYGKRQKGELILSESKDVAEHLKITSASALKFFPWDK